MEYEKNIYLEFHNKIHFPKCDWLPQVTCSPPLKHRHVSYINPHLSFAPKIATRVDFQFAIENIGWGIFTLLKKTKTKIKKSELQREWGRRERGRRCLLRLYKPFSTSIFDREKKISEAISKQECFFLHFRLIPPLSTAPRFLDPFLSSSVFQI